MRWSADALVRHRGLLLEIGAVAVLLAVAAVVRADGFMVLPRLTDETLEARLGLRLAREGGLPLVGFAPHIGSLYSYLVAGTFLLVGPKIEAARLVVVVTGTLTVLPTYLLGRDLGALVGGTLGRGRIAGLTAGLLLALSGPHIAASSRIAYSNSLTPLFAATGLWLAHRAVSRRSDRALIGCALALGLAVQTHVSALAVLPGIGAAILLPLAPSLLRGRLAGGWPGPRALIVAAGAGLLAIANLLVYNLLVGAATVGTAENRIGRYVGADAWTPEAWADRLTRLLRAAMFAVGGQANELDWPPEALLSPVVLVAVGLALLGLWACARRGVWLPALVTLSTILVVSALNGRVEPIVPRVRHYATLVPLGAVAIAVGLAWLAARLEREGDDRCALPGGPHPPPPSPFRGRGGARQDVAGGALEPERCPHPPPPSPFRGRGGARQDVAGGSAATAWRRWGARGLLLIVPVLLAGGSMQTFHSYAAERMARPDKNNAAFLAVVASASASGPTDERLYLDDVLLDQLTMSGGRMLSHLRYAFEVTGQEMDTIDVARDRLPLGGRDNPSRRLILAAETIPLAERRYQLVPLPGEPGEGAPVRAFRAFARPAS